jgi:hypothetical protein
VASLSLPVYVVYFLTQVGIVPYRKVQLEFEAFSSVYDSEIYTVKTSIFWLGLGIFAYLALSSLLHTYTQRATAVEESTQQARDKLHQAEDLVASRESLDLPVLWAVTQRRLDYYHQIATGQARQSFRNAQIAMGVGFVLLLVFAFLSVNSVSIAGSVVSGSLGASSAILTGYIGRTVKRSQENAAFHLRSYFLQPLEFSRYLAAERVIASLPKDTPKELMGVIVRAIANEKIDDEPSNSSKGSPKAERS